MNFIDYCIATKNYSTLSAIEDYTKAFGLTSEDNRERRKIVTGALGGLAGAYLLGRHHGGNSAEEDYELNLRRWRDSGHDLNSESDLHDFMEEYGYD